MGYWFEIPEEVQVHQRVFTQEFYLKWDISEEEVKSNIPRWLRKIEIIEIMVFLHW